MSEASDIKVPDLGDFSDVEIIEILVKAGDEVAKEDGLITLETDKAAMDVPAERDGVIEEILVEEGTRVPVGTVLARVSAGTGYVPAMAEEAHVTAGAAAEVAKQDFGGSYGYVMD